jgi:hypothetical protein
MVETVKESAAPDQGDDRGIGDAGLGGLAVQLIEGTGSPVLRR